METIDEENKNLIILLFIFAFGSVIGLILFSKILNLLIIQHKNIIMSCLVGFILGSIGSVWPWTSILYEDNIGTLFLKSNNNKVDESKISFNIGPRINAAGRMKNGKIIVDLLVEEDPNKAMSLSNEVEFLNLKRRATEKDVFENVVENIDHSKYSNIIYGQNWSTGVLGIVASRIIEKSYKPTIIITDFDKELLTGSVRSVSGFDVYDALVKCEKYLHQFGGHKFAAGVKIEKSKLNLFSEHFEKTVKESVNGNMFERKHKYDLEVSFSDLTIENVKIISRMSPFGLENKRPIFRSDDCKIIDDLKFVGKESQIVKSYIMDSSNTKLPFISFSKKDELVNLKSSFNILFNTIINSYSGKDQVEIIIKEISSN